MTFRSGTSRNGEGWMSSGTLHEHMAAPAHDESSSPQAKQRASDQAIELALAQSPGALQTTDGLIYEQSATGGFSVSSPNSARHKLAQLAAEEAEAVAAYKAKYGVS